MTRLAILGAGGHGRVVADAAFLAGWGEVVFFDDAWPQSKTTGPWPVAGKMVDLLQNRMSFDAVVVAIGDNQTRLSMQRGLLAEKIVVASVVHPRAVVSAHACVEPGCVILAGAVISAFAVLGAGCIINTGASVDHDCVLREGVHLSPGAHLGGAVRIGDASWIGLGAVVKEGVSIGSNVKVGAGAAVIGNVPDGATVVGVPARPFEQRSR